jgi:hypothetical protein
MCTKVGVVDVQLLRLPLHHNLQLGPLLLLAVRGGKARKAHANDEGISTLHPFVVVDAKVLVLVVANVFLERKNQRCMRKQAHSHTPL